MKTYKLKGLEYYVQGVYNEIQAATVCLKYKIGVMPTDLEEFKGDIPIDSIILN